LRKNDELNESFRSEGWPPYETRFGLHVGDAVVGNVGSSERMNYTALGATVNLAARLEGLNKNYGTRVLASAAVKAGAEHRFVFRSVDRISPKGFAEAVAIHELRCAREGDVGAELAFCRRWEEVYASIEHDDPASALAAISAFLSEYPADSVARYYAEHVQGGLHSGRPRGAGTGLRKRAR
jgi:adenylate cyclase